LALADSLSTPLLLVDRQTWRIEFINASARRYFGVESGTPLTASLTGLNTERINTRLAKGRIAEHAHKMKSAQMRSVLFKFFQYSDTLLLVEGVDESHKEEYQAILNSYSLLMNQHNDKMAREKRDVETLLLENQVQHRDLQTLVRKLESKNEELGIVHRRVQEELNLARSVQLAILPQQFPQSLAWDIHACMHPARELGGDFYDCLPLPDGRLGILVADVSGKGVGAAFFMAVSRTVLIEAAIPVRSATQVLSIANGLLCANNPLDLFVTACYGLYDPADGSLVYASAGHSAPLVRRRDGAVESLPLTHDMALGVLSDVVYTEHRLQLAPGDILLMYTDGVTEAFSRREEPYGYERLTQWLAYEQGNRNAAAMVDELVANVARFVDGAEPSDDLTCLVLRRY
jgi:serine phosphatase RsbU (regulator of sigma subunit)